MKYKFHFAPYPAYSGVMHAAPHMTCRIVVNYFGEYPS